MREIKFRAWDKKKKEWVGYEVGGVMDLTYSGKCNAFMFDNDNLDIPESVEWTQYTGLKDKNGKEIYEGDIFDCPYSNETKNHHRWRVIWGNISGGFVLQRIGEACNQNQVHQTVSNLVHREIIGNIYENPELIK